MGNVTKKQNMKLKIKLIFLGHLPYSIDSNKIEKWKSDLFEIVKPIDRHIISTDSDGEDWSFTDENIEGLLPNRNSENILIAITNVPLEDNYYARRFNDDRICVTFNEITEILESGNIPLENFIFKVIYSASLVYKRYGNRIPEMFEMTNFTHDETRGCLFDMNGIKTDIIYSTNQPEICPSCILDLANSKVPKNLIDKIQKEIKGIQKELYYKITDFIKGYPIGAIFISSATAIILGFIGSILASYIWEKWLQ